MNQTHISPAVAQHAANECERLRKVNAELVEALKEILVGAEMEQCANYAQSESCRRIIAKVARAALKKAQS